MAPSNCITISELANTLVIRDGTLFATSRDVAERFEKDHFHVLRAIENIECSQEFRASNFAGSSYVSKQNKSMPMVEMTRDGFSFLVMGFTGKEAAVWKEKYIAAFNWLEEQFRGPATAEKRHAFSDTSGIFRDALSLAKLIGFEGNQAVLSANKSTRKLTGMDVLALMDVTHLKADPRGMTYTPTQLGDMCNPMMSARMMNQKLEAEGFQHREGDDWTPTVAGHRHGEWLDTGKRHSDGTPVKQLKWFKSVLGSQE